MKCISNTAVTKCLAGIADLLMAYTGEPRECYNTGVLTSWLLDRLQVLNLKVTVIYMVLGH